MSEKERYTPLETKRKITSLDDLFDSQRKLPPAYIDLMKQQEQELARGNEAVRNPAAYAERWNFLVYLSVDQYLKNYQGLEEYEYVKEDYETLDRLLKKHLPSTPLIDLGSGDGYFVEQIAHKYKVDTYIGIDRNHGDPRDDELPSPQIAIKDAQIGDLRRILVKADILDFVARLRPGVINFTLNGIDLLIIDNERYHEALAQEILRVAQSGSLIFGVDSRVLEILSSHADAENSALKEYPVDELTEMREFHGHIFEIVK